MAMKVKTAIEGRLLKLLGGKKVMEKKPADENQASSIPEKAKSEDLPKVEAKKEEIFLTSAKAKRYHKEKCPFAQNIPADNKIILSKEEAEKSARKPCTCVSGKKIPLVKPSKAAETEKDQTKKGKKSPAQDPASASEKKRGGEASLDDIANLFK